MATSLGSLVVSLGLNAAEFVGGLTKSEAEARKFARQIDSGLATAAKTAGIAFAALGLSATGAIAAVQELVDRAGHFQDLAEKTGAAAEEMAGFDIALRVTGKSADDLGDFMVKLGKGLVGVNDGTDKAGAALRALGIDIAKFKQLDPAQKVDALSKALANFSDVGGGKANVLNALAKGAADFLPFLKELNEEGGRQKILTDQQITQADAYTDAQKRTKATLLAYAEVIAIQLTPSIIALTTASTEFLKELVGIDQSTTDLANGSAVQTWADNAVRALAKVVNVVDGIGRAFDITGKLIGAGAAQIGAIASGEFRRAREIGAAFFADFNRIAAKPQFSAKLENAIRNRVAPTPKPKDDRPKVDFEGANKENAASKSILDGQLKLLEIAIAREKEDLNARADYLQFYFQEGLLSVSDYYNKLQDARDTALNNTLRFYDEMIAAERSFQDHAKTANEREQAAAKISEIQEKQNALLQKAGHEEEQLSRQREKSSQQYQDQLDEINAKILEIQGNSAAAASIRFDNVNRFILNATKASGDTKAQADLATIKEQQKNLEDLADAQRKYSNQVELTGIALARIDLLQQTGAITEIDAINKRAEAARKEVAVLTQKADVLQSIAEKLEAGPARDAALIQVQKLRLEIDQLAAASDVLAKKFNDIFAGAIADGIVELVNGTKKLKDVLQDVGKSISTQITQIAAKQVSDSLFAKGGALGGVGDFFAGIFGGGKDTGAAALTTAGSTLNVAGVGLNTAAVALTSSAAALAASSAAGALGGFGGAGSGVFGSGGLSDILGGLFSSGGRPPVGKLSVVGERGPELFIPDSSGVIIPNSELEKRRASRSGDTYITVNVPTGTSGPSAHQIATVTARRLEIARNKSGR